MKKPTVGELDDGTVLFWILHEFRDDGGACDLILRLVFPVAAREVWFVEHAEHLCMEFSSGLALVWENLQLHRGEIGAGTSTL